MSNFLIFIAFFNTILLWSKKPIETKVKNADFIESTAEQLDYLHLLNTRKSGFVNDWYVVILGKDKKEMSSFLNDIDYEHVKVTSKHHQFDIQTIKKINEELIEINKHEKYAAYAFITDNKKEIIIPTVPIKEKQIGKFLTKLEGKLITAGFDTPQEITSYKSQKEIFLSIEKRIRESQKKTNSEIENLIADIYNQTKDFKNSSKSYKLLCYSVLTYLNFKLKVDDNPKKYYVKVYGTQHRYAKGDNPNINRTIVNGYIKGSNLDFSSPENRMLARVKAYKKYIETETLSVEGLHEGIGKRVYINQKNLVTDESSEQKLIELSNFLTETYSKQNVTNKYEVIVDYLSKEVNKDRKDILTVIAENDIITKEAFLKLYPYNGVARQYEKGYNAFRVYFSNTHLWTKTGNLDSNEVISDNYNKNSVDFFASKGKSIVQTYHYSLKDLINRYKLVSTGDTNTVLTRFLLKTESEGTAYAIHQSEFYRQYLKKFGTNAAYPFIAETSSNWARDLLAAYLIQRVAVQYGAFLLEEVAKQVGKEVLKKIIKEHGKDALQGALIDYGAQVAFNYILDDKITNFKQAASPSKINWLSVAWSAGENTIKYNNRLVEWGVAGAGACLVNGISEAGGFKDSFDYQGCVINLGITYGVKGLFKVGASPYLRKQVIDAFKKGQDKFRNLLINRGKSTPQQADEIIENIEKAINNAEDDLPIGTINVVFNWKSILGKKINDLTEAPEGYSFYFREGKKLIKKDSGSTKPTLSAKDGVVRYGAGFANLIRDEFGVVFNKFDSWDKKLKEVFIKDFDNQIDSLTDLNKNPDLVDSWKKIDDIGDNAFKTLKKDPDFLKKFDDVVKNDGLNKHVLDGEVKPVIDQNTGLQKLAPDGTPQWKVSGAHSADALDPNKLRIKGEKNYLGDKGYYEAKIEAKVESFTGQPYGNNNGWKVKGDKSTFFPDSWSIEKIQAEIANGLKNKVQQNVFSDGRIFYKGAMSDGTSLAIYIKNGVVESVFPSFK